MWLQHKNVQRAWLALLLAFPIALWLLPSGVFDNTGIEICPSKLFFDFECLGCGMTRAVMHFHHFEIEEAVYYNIGVVVIYPALVFVWFVWARAAARRSGIWQPAAPKQDQPVG